MNWEAVGAIGEITGALIVVVTLIYVVLQVRYVRQQVELTSMQHIYDSLTSLIDLIASSESVTSIVRRGRASYASLSEDEKLRFDHVYGRCLNALESWSMHVNRAMKPGAYREAQLRNIRETIRFYCAYPGVIEFWPSIEENFHADIHKLVEGHSRGQGFRLSDSGMTALLVSLRRLPSVDTFVAFFELLDHLRGTDGVRFDSYVYHSRCDATN